MHSPYGILQQFIEHFIEIIKCTDFSSGWIIEFNKSFFLILINIPAYITFTKNKYSFGSYISNCSFASFNSLSISSLEAPVFNSSSYIFSSYFILFRLSFHIIF